MAAVIPAYNEEKNIADVLKALLKSPELDEIIVVDDGSADNTAKVLIETRYPNLKIIHHMTNRGKGAAVLTALEHACGEYVIIQDADLEYDPADYLRLMEVMSAQGADIVLGARFTKGYHGSFIPRLGNRILTGLLNWLYGTKLNDCFTCYKLFRRDTITALGLKAQSFDIEIEIVSKVIKNKLRLMEVPISYIPRTYAEGKKIRIKDGIHAIISIFKYRFQG